MTTAYHLTTSAGLPFILKEGLQPKIGERSRDCNEQEPAVYLFPTEDDLENALSGWLGEVFPEDEILHVLAVDMSDVPQESVVEWEIIVHTHIEPNRITYLRSE